MQKLIKYIDQRLILSEKDISLLYSLFTPIRLLAKNTFIKEGLNAHYLYFVLEGVIRGFKYQNGKIIVEHLAAEKTFVTALDSFLKGSPSTDNFETLTDCELLKISKVDWDRLKASGGKWNRLIESIISESLSCKMERLNDFQRLNAKERYLKFIDQHSDLVLRVSVENIASYLGVEPQSLSRIRKQLTI
ncbi:MAG: Crp/Fnr family transcriptional regulator [Bacteroidota bacterium]